MNYWKKRKEFFAGTKPYSDSVDGNDDEDDDSGLYSDEELEEDELEANGYNDDGDGDLELRPID